MPDNNTQDYIEIKPEYLYLTIPANWVCVYHKLLNYMADFGKTIIDDCTATCKGNGKNIITCWNLFQSAIAARTLGKLDEAEFFIKYIKRQLQLIYRGSDEEVYDGTLPLAITDDGLLKAIVSCQDDGKFYVDAKTGILYQEWIDSKNNYSIKDNNLIVEK